MTLTELHYIIALAKEQHFRRAAESCHVSQPTLSIAISKLEDELGVLLFERGHKRVQITPIGQQIVAQANKALEQIKSIKQIAKTGKDQLNEPLRIGVIYTIGPYLLPQLVPSLHRLAPNMPLIVEENFTINLAHKLKQGEIDVIIISFPFAENGILTLPLYDEPFVVIVPENHALSKKSRVSVDDLTNEEILLLGPGHCFRDQVLEVCPHCVKSKKSASLRPNLDNSSLETIRHMVATGMGISVLPISAAGEYHSNKQLLNIKDFKSKPPTRRVALAWRSSFPRPKVIDVIREAITKSRLKNVKILT